VNFAGPATTVMTGGRISTLADDEHAPGTATAIAIRGDRVLAIGGDDDIEGLAIPATRRIDLGGRRVIPGLIDSHVHFVRAGRTWNDEVRWEDVYTLDDALALIRERAVTLLPGEWIRVIGGWDEHQFREGRGPTRAELDQAGGDHPVYVQMQYTYAVLNTLGMRALGIDDEQVAASPHPGGFDRDAGGALTGRAWGLDLMTWFYRQLPPPTLEQQVQSTIALSREFGRLGMTGAIDGGGVNTGPEAYAAISEAWSRGALGTRVRLFKHATRKGTEAEDFGGYLRYEHPGFGDGLLRTAGLGEILMYRTHDRIGKPADSSDEAMAETRDLLSRAAAQRWPVQIHAHERDFVDRLLDAMESVHAETPIDDLRWSFVHGETIGASDIPRLRTMGIGLAFQSLLRYNGESAIEAWGAERVAHAPELRDLLEAGIPVGLGSDAMRVASYNPFASMQWFITGLTLRGTETLKAPHLLTRQEALRGYTHGGAWFTREEHERGQLLPGRLADLAVLSDDFFEVPVEELHVLTSELTMVGGETVWETGAVR
jgi:predicted amidohydrolase YtcJ